MAGMSSDLEILKDIPGYKAILKSVLKSQIQLLIEQLSDHTGEETIILTASVHDGTLSHLGSNTGKGFLDGRDEIKSQFLAFCLKSHHRRKSTEARLSPYQRPQSGGPADRLTPSQGLSHKRPRLQPVSLQRAVGGDSSGNSFTPPDIHRAPSQNFSTNGQDSSSGVNVKLETSEQGGNSTDNTNLVAGSVSFPTSLQLSHTQTSVEQGTSDTNENQNDDDFTEQNSENEDSTAASIKIEPITESEMELEITGVEPGKTSVSADTWGQGQVLGTSGVGEGASNETGDQGGYMSESEEREQPDSIDLTGDDDNDIDSTQVSGIISTVPNFTPGDAGSCNFSIVNVSSLSTPAQTVVPGFLYEQSVADIQIEGSSSFVPVGEDYDNRETIEEEPGDPNASWEHSDGSQATDASYYGNVKDNNEGHDVDDPTAFMRPSIPINPLKHVQFNKEFYGKSKTRIVLKRHICPICGKRLLKKSDLDRHVRVHTGEKPFTCPVCRKRFSQKHNVDLHRRRKNH